MRGYNRQYDKGRVVELDPACGPPSVEVDQAYEKTADLVARMIAAGERLEAARAAGFSFPTGEDQGETPEELVRSPGFDLADASALTAAARRRAAVRRSAAAAGAAAAPAEAPLKAPEQGQVAEKAK